MPEAIPHHMRRPGNAAHPDSIDENTIVPLPLPILQFQSKDRSLICRDGRLAVLIARGAIAVLLVLILSTAAVFIVRAVYAGDSGLFSDSVESIQKNGTSAIVLATSALGKMLTHPRAACTA